MTNSPVPANVGEVLLSTARAAIAKQLGLESSVDESAPWLTDAGACFVTLTQEGALRGCIGSLEAWRPLLEDVQANAVAAAFHDPRSPPLTRAELDQTQLEVSVLSAPEPMSFTSEADALAQLRPGIDGLILAYGNHRGTFLPQVWEQLPEPAQFLAHLKLKAGLPVQFWSDDITLARYTVTAWHEAD